MKTRVLARAWSCRTRASGWISELRVHDHPQGVASLDEAAGEFRVVLRDGARAHEDGVVMAPQAVGKDPGRLRADPAGMPCRGCDFPVDGLGEFQRDEGDAGPDVLEEDLVDLPALILEHAHAGLDPVPLERCDPPSRNERVGVDRADDDRRRLLAHQPLHAGRGPAVVRTGLQVDIDRGAADRFRRALDGVDLGVIFSAAAVPAFPDDPAVLYDDRPHERVGAGPGRPSFRQFEGHLHVTLVGHSPSPSIGHQKVMFLERPLQAQKNLPEGAPLYKMRGVLYRLNVRRSSRPRGMIVFHYRDAVGLWYKTPVYICLSLLGTEWRVS